MELGVQLFGGMRYYNEDPAAFLKKLKDAGYDRIEPCVAFGGRTMPFAWSAEDAPARAAQAAEIGLGIHSVHAFCANPAECLPQMIELAKRLGIKAYVVGLRPPFDRAALDAFIANCRATAEGLAAAGVELYLHNNAAEIAAKIDGVSAYEYVLNACGSALGAQVDTGWVVCGGEALDAFLTRIASCVRSIHHKDVAGLTDANGKTVNVALGAGIVDNEFAYRFAAEKGLTQITDQDNSEGSFVGDLAASADYLKKLEEKNA